MKIFFVRFYLLYHLLCLKVRLWFTRNHATRTQAQWQHQLLTLNELVWLWHTSDNASSNIAVSVAVTIVTILSKRHLWFLESLRFEFVERRSSIGLYHWFLKNRICTETGRSSISSCAAWVLANVILLSSNHYWISMGQWLMKLVDYVRRYSRLLSKTKWNHTNSWNVSYMDHKLVSCVNNGWMCTVQNRVK